MNLETLRHSCAHVMADAVKRLFPEARLAIGPAIENGFYYDFDYPRGFTPDDLKAIEAKMEEIIRAKLPFEKSEMTKKEAINFFSERGENYKIEIINELPEEKATIYRDGDFVDLCRGPHIKHTGEIKAFKLLKVAGAYWRGDEKGRQLQRIYGTAFPSKKELTEYLKRLEEAEGRDHRKLGQELDLYSSMEEFGPGLILWHPKGARIRRAIEDFWRAEHEKNGYEIVFTPHIARLDLWKISGHWEFYRENMYSPMDIDGVDYELKPMNCPFHIQIYKSRMRSWRDFPMRYAELGTVYRYERSGVIQGLLRVRGFTQDDAHIFCRDDQLNEEVYKVLSFTLFMLKSFGFEKYDVCLSTKPEKHVGDDAGWEAATNALEAALKKSKLKYEVDAGEGVFYGPKIDIKIKDVLDRAWQCSTIQVDFNMPERHEIEFVGKDGARHQPIMIHRALLGSLERFFGVMIEHYGGAFPVWLAPVQTVILTITDAQKEYSEDVAAKLRFASLRVELDDRNEKLGLKIREAQLQKVPFMLVIGEKEASSKLVAVRSRNKGDIGAMKLEKFIEIIDEEIKGKK